MSCINSTKGSEWRRWDLHIHTPDTKLSNAFTGENEEQIWNEYIKALEASDIQAFGITDYYSCENYFKLIDKYKEKYPDSGKVFFPNIEFRFSEAISKDNSNPNVHVIFDYDEKKCSRSQIEKLLSKLKVLGENSSGAPVYCSDLKSTSDFESASISIEDLKKALKKAFGSETPYLIVFPANNDGIKTTDVKSPRKVKASDTMDGLADLFFGNSKNKTWFLRSDRYEVGKSLAKPVVSFSDAHSFKELERLEGNVANYEPTWIKADLTFRGLQQICFEPDTRVFIGEEPPVNIRKAQQATKFISKLRISQIPGYDNRNGEWFQNVDIPINPELTAIIGNKGSGKSALVDIIGLLGESSRELYFSFLSNKTKNKKFKQKGYAENFTAELEWESSTSTSKFLSETVDLTKPETVRYLPQNYFEELTNDIEIEAFRREIEDVVFSHVSDANRMGCPSFVELQEFKTSQSKHETSTLKTSLRELNIEITQLEDENDPLFRKKMDEELKAKKVELEVLKTKKPHDEEKPDGETAEQKELSENIGRLTDQLNQLELKAKQNIQVIANKKNRLQKLVSLQQSIIAIDTYVTRQKEELNSVCSELELNLNDIVTVEIKLTSVERLRLEISNEIEVLEKNNECVFTDVADFSLLSSIPDLRAAYKYIKQQATELKEKLGTPQRKYQTYIDKLAKWDAQRLEVIGNKEKPETIKYIEAKVDYIDNELSEKLTIAYDKRKKVSKEIFESKDQILHFYSELKQSVEEKLSDVRTDDFFVNIDAAFILEQSFVQTFLNFINKKKRGSFYSSDGAQKLIKELLSDVDWNDFDSIYDFIEATIKKIKNYGDRPNPIKEQITNVKEFYDLLFSLEYFVPRYELCLGDKKLNELSPGEKGLLLLVFYLQLDKHNTPLIIDQPEDNLDNESIFTVLANCIREAKKNRQVILVTHNPNLAVGADAEQIIYVQLEKSRNYKFSYETGAIENPRINEKIVIILEGTQPAFVKRRLKYQI